MQRRAILVVMALATAILAACSDVTAPRQDGPCLSGYANPNGLCSDSL